MNKILVLYNGSEWIINLDFIESVYYNYKEHSGSYSLTIGMSSGEQISFTASKINQDYENQKEAIIKLWEELIK
jgi:hypothetical protein